MVTGALAEVQGPPWRLAGVPRWPWWIWSQTPLSPPRALQLPLDSYLPRNQVLELLDLFVGLGVLLQVPLCKEGLVETGRDT